MLKHVLFSIEGFFKASRLEDVRVLYIAIYLLIKSIYMKYYYQILFYPQLSIRCINIKI